MNAMLEQFIAHPAHAVLVTGPAETAAAEAIAAAQALLGAHQEQLRTVVPEKDGTRMSIGIAQVRALNEFFRLRVPAPGTIKRAAVITEADAMTREAQNALLKLLEEPPADAVLLLAAADPEKLLPTIHSRVQLIRLQGGQAKPEDSALQLVKQALGGTTFDRLVMIDSTLKAKETARQFVATLVTVAEASLQATAKKSGALSRWQKVLQAAITAQDALMHSGNQKLVLTELMLEL